MWETRILNLLKWITKRSYFSRKKNDLFQKDKDY